MNLLDAFISIPAYTFRLQIERGNRTIFETAIAAKENAAEVAKVKKTIQRLLDEYTPAIQQPKPVLTPEPAQADAQPQAEPEAQDSPTYAPEAEQQPEDPAEAVAPKKAHERPPLGAKNLLRLHCSECGDTFGIFLREYQTEVLCRCGHSIDLTAPLARYHFTCPNCKHEGFGKTNLEDPEITVRCMCGRDVELRWNSKAREYQD